MIGKTISHYRIIEKLGEGGMGIVYKARDTTLDRDVALKFLPHYLSGDPGEKERFYHEARAAAALAHQNIAVVHEIGEHEGHIFIAMEFVEGRTLKEIATGQVSSKERSDIRDASVLPMNRILDIAIQVCDGLAAAHEKNVVHRDIKSENIMLTARNQIKIMDFGLAKVKGATKLTKEGSTLGTAAYMSPEQARGEEVDHRSDIFSFGVVLYELLTGRLPFRGEHHAALMYSIVNEQPQPLLRFNEKVTPEIEHIVAKALEKERDDRYQHFDEMLADLRRERKHMEYARTGYATTPAITATETALHSKETDRSPRSKPLTKIFAAIGIAAVAVLAFVLLRPLVLEEAISSEKRTVAVISFINQTGDPSYDYLQDAIPNLLITNLEQSKYLSVATWERLYDLRKQAGKPDTKIIEREMGFELCKMDDIEAIVLGSFTKAGDVFATDVKVLDVRTKQLLKSVSSKGDGVGSILKIQIDELSKEISRGIGLSERKVESTPMQIAEHTTESMDAYNYFLRGRDDYQKYYFDEALKYLQKAVSIDSEFASAYVYLALTYTNLYDYKSTIAAYQMAARFQHKASEKDRLKIAAAIARNVENDPEKADVLLRESKKKYPKDKWVYLYLGSSYVNREMIHEAIDEFTSALQLDPEFGAVLNQLGYAYSRIGDFEKAIGYFKRYAASSPGDANPHDSMAELYFKMGKLDDAIAKYREVLEIRPGFSSTNLCLAYVYLLDEDFENAMSCADQFISGAASPGMKAEGYWSRAIFSYYGAGKLRQSMNDLDKARGLFALTGNEKWVALTDLLMGWILYDRGETKASRALFKRYFDSEGEKTSDDQSISRNVFTLGLLALQEDKISAARLKLAELDTLLSSGARPALKQMRYIRDHLYAEILIAEDSAEQALRSIEKIGLPDLPNFRPDHLLWYNIPFARDMAARAYTRKGAYDKAIAEYEKIVAFDAGSNDRRLIFPKYRYKLAKLCDERGLRGKAAQEYEIFLRLWKDADPDLTEVKEARARLKKLKTGTTK